MHYIAPFQSPIVFVLSALAGGCFAVMKYTKSFFFNVCEKFFYAKYQTKICLHFSPTYPVYGHVGR